MNEETEATIDELNELIDDLYNAAEGGYGWICNYPETTADIVQAKQTVSKAIGDLLYRDPRLEEYRRARSAFTRAEQTAGDLEP